jgi:AmmeMemoRadiSam system protein B
MVSVMRAARLLGAARAATLRYADSGDISGDKSSVVGYLAAALWR